ncbi:hypothetical protein Bca52824_036132 [Brassica carinata]|uniref:RNase H type-1 domain-containing protein n=1 Tax=Brassica carinata TaxID=52824 RepID=A0A8X7S456_BRACI|nr:hypothetical protein Bca52824_036132 [Brassica carinata]
MEPAHIASKAHDDALVWVKLHQVEKEENSVQVEDGFSPKYWKKPPFGFVKCNIGTSWSPHSRHSGSSWIIMDFRGKALVHSRRALIDMGSGLEADIASLSWAIEDVLRLRWNKVVFEISSRRLWEALKKPSSAPALSQATSDLLISLNRLSQYQIELVPLSCNTVAEEIAKSVVRDNRLQSYVAQGGPSWLSNIILVEAN